MFLPFCLPGRPRGSYDHVQFTISYKAKSFTRAYNTVQRMDLIQFARFKVTTRGWTRAQSEKDTSDPSTLISTQRLVMLLL